jgi:hypothetical protein
MNLNASLQDGLERSIQILNKYPDDELGGNQDIFDQPVLGEWAEQAVDIVPEGVTNSHVRGVVMAIAPYLLRDNVLPDDHFVTKLGYYSPGYPSQIAPRLRLNNAISEAVQMSNILINPVIKTLDPSIWGLSQKRKREAIQQLSEVVIGNFYINVPFGTNYFANILQDWLSVRKNYTPDGDVRYKDEGVSILNRPESYIKFLTKTVHGLGNYLKADLKVLGYRRPSDDFGLGHHVRNSLRT